MWIVFVMIELDEVTKIIGLHVSLKELEMVVLIVWKIWESKNSMLFWRMSFDSDFISDLVERCSHAVRLSCVDSASKAVVRNHSNPHPPTPIGWYSPLKHYWKLNSDVAWHLNRRINKLGWVLQDHLSSVHLAGFKFICEGIKSQCRSMWTPCVISLFEKQKITEE